MCKVTKIENDKIYYQRSGPWEKEIEDVAELILDKQNTKRQMNANEIDSIYHSKRQTPDSLLIKIRQKKNKLEDRGYFRQTIKINPGSFINEYTVKYEYRLNYRFGLQFEAGYIHTLWGQFTNIDFVATGMGTPFIFNGVVARTGVKWTLSKLFANYRKSISLNFFYKYQQHERTYFMNKYEQELSLSRIRSVYGTSILFSTEKYVNRFLIEFYGGISLRYVFDQNMLYDYYSFFGDKLPYDPPKRETRELWLPAIQGGINIGFGFNGKKKKE